MVPPDPKIEGATSPEQIHQQIAQNIENHLSQAGAAPEQSVIPVTADTQVNLADHQIEIVSQKAPQQPAPPKLENPITQFWLDHIKPWFYPIARQTKSQKFLKTGISRQVEKIEGQ